MPPEFQESTKRILQKITTKTLSFIHDILLVIKGTEESHMKTVEEAIRAMDEAGIRLKLEKCKVAKAETECLGYNLSAAGMKPVDEKVQAITEKLRPGILQDLRSLMEAINQMIKFIPNMANLSPHYGPY